MIRLLDKERDLAGLLRLRATVFKQTGFKLCPVELLDIDSEVIGYFVDDELVGAVRVVRMKDSTKEYFDKLEKEGDLRIPDGSIILDRLQFLSTERASGRRVLKLLKYLQDYLIPSGAEALYTLATKETLSIYTRFGFKEFAPGYYQADVGNIYPMLRPLRKNASDRRVLKRRRDL